MTGSAHFSIGGGMAYKERFALYFGTLIPRACLVILREVHVQGEPEALTDADWADMLEENSDKKSPAAGAGLQARSKSAGPSAPTTPSRPPPGFENAVRAGMRWPETSECREGGSRGLRPWLSTFAERVAVICSNAV